jgi:hypothetical protein
VFKDKRLWRRAAQEIGCVGAGGRFIPEASDISTAKPTGPTRFRSWLAGGFLDDNDSLVPNTLGSLKLEMCFRTDWRLLLKLKYMSFSIKEQL